MPSLQISAQTLSPELIDDLTLDESTSTSTESTTTTVGSGANLAISETDNEDEVTLTFNFSSVPPSWLEDGVSVYGLGGDEDYKLDLTTNKVGDSETYSGQITVPSSLIADGTNIYVSNPSTETDAKSTFGLFGITSAKLANLKSAGIANFASTLTSVNTEDLPAELTKAIEEAKKKADTKSASHSCDEFLTQNPVKYGLCNLINMVGESVSGWITNSSNAILNTITDWNNARGDALGEWVANGWGMTRNLVNIIAVIALVIVAFANILHINLNVYAVKRMLPLLIGSVIGANLSLFAIKAINVFSYQIASSIVDPASSGIGDLAKTVSTLFGSLLLAAFGMGDAAAIAFSSVGLVVEAVPVMIILLLIFIAAAVLLLILGFLMYIQPGVVGILTVFAPLAIILGALPFGQGTFKKWLTFTFNWIFMLPVCLLMFALINVLTTKGYGTTESIFALAGQIAILIFAVRVPFMMGGDIMKGWAGAGNFGREYLGHVTKLGAQRSIMADEAIKNKIAAGKKLTMKESYRNLLNKTRIAKAVRNISPSEVIIGTKQRIEGEKAFLEGSVLSSSLSRRRSAGKGTSMRDEYESKVKSSPRMTKSSLKSKIGKLNNDELGTLLFYSTISAGKAYSFEDAGTYRGGKDGTESGANLAYVEEWFRRMGARSFGGLLDNKDLVLQAKNMAEERNISLLSDIEAKILGQAMSKLNGEVINEEDIQKDIAREKNDKAREYKEEQFKIAKEQRDMLDKIYERRNDNGKSVKSAFIDPEDGVPIGSGIEAAVELGNEISSTLGEKVNPNANVANQIKQRIESNDPSRAKDPIGIASADEYRVVAEGVERAVCKLGNDLKEVVKKENPDPNIHNKAIGAIETVNLAPATVRQMIEKDGTAALVGRDVKLSQPTDRLMRTFVMKATQGSAITKATAEDFYKRNLSEISPYIDNIANATKEGKLNPGEIGAISGRINSSLESMKSGAGLSDAQIQALRTDLSKVSPGVKLSTSMTPEQLLVTGRNVTDALDRVKDPAVMRVLEQKGSPQEVQEVIVKQAAQGLIRQTSVDRITSIASQPQKPVTVKVREVARQVGSFASNSSSAQQWGGLSPVAKQQVATEVARQVVGIKGVDEATVAKAVADKLATVRTTGGTPAPQAAQATQPALNVPGAAAQPTAPTPAPTAPAQPSTAPQPPTAPAPSTPSTPTPPPSPQTQPPPTPPGR